LHEFYEDARAKEAISSPFEAEFCGYQILCTLDMGGGMDVLKFIKGLPKTLRSHTKIQFASAVFVARRMNNYVAFFRLLRNATFLQACLMHRYVPNMRSKALEVMNRGFNKRSPVPVMKITELLCFEDDIEARAICTPHGLTIDATTDEVQFGSTDFQTEEELRQNHHHPRQFIMEQDDSIRHHLDDAQNEHGSSGLVHGNDDGDMEDEEEQNHGLASSSSANRIAMMKKTQPKIVSTQNKRMDRIIGVKQGPYTMRRDICRGVTEYKMEKQNKSDYPCLPSAIFDAEEEERKRLYPERPRYVDPYSRFEQDTVVKGKNDAADDTIERKTDLGMLVDQSLGETSLPSISRPSMPLPSIPPPVLSPLEPPPKDVQELLDEAQRIKLLEDAKKQKIAEMKARIQKMEQEKNRMNGRRTLIDAKTSRNNQNQQLDSVAAVTIGEDRLHPLASLKTASTCSSSSSMNARTSSSHPFTNAGTRVEQQTATITMTTAASSSFSSTITAAAAAATTTTTTTMDAANVKPRRDLAQKLNLIPTRDEVHGNNNEVQAATMTESNVTTRESHETETTERRESIQDESHQAISATNRKDAPIDQDSRRTHHRNERFIIQQERSQQEAQAFLSRSLVRPSRRNEQDQTQSVPTLKKRMISDGSTNVSSKSSLVNEKDVDLKRLKHDQHPSTFECTLDPNAYGQLWLRIHFDAHAALQQKWATQAAAKAKRRQALQARAIQRFRFARWKSFVLVQKETPR
jgi:hypothetical protein